MEALLRARLPRTVHEVIIGGTTRPDVIPGTSRQSTRRLLDDDIPELSQQPLQPTEHIPPFLTPPPRAGRFRQKLARWGSWFLRFVPEPVKRPINNAFETFKKKVMSLYPKQYEFEESIRSALKGFVTRHRIKPPKNQTFDPKTFLIGVRQKALEKFKPQTKVRLVLRARMEQIQPSQDGESVIEVRNFQSKSKIVLESTDLDELWKEIMEQIFESNAVFQKNGSGWTFHSIVSLDIHTVKYKPLRGGTWVPTSKFLADKKALINLSYQSKKKNAVDVQCFNWCIAKALNPVQKYSGRISKTLQEQAKSLKFDGIEIPTSLKDISKFEKQSPEISVNVLGYEEDEWERTIFPLIISKTKDRQHEVNLLLLEDKHYVLIKSLSKLLIKQLSKCNGKRHFCLRCMNSFTKKEVLDKHREYCENHDFLKIIMPQFKNHNRKTQVVVFADFECITKKIHSTQSNPENSFTEAYQKHNLLDSA